MFDASDGLFFEDDEGTVKVVCRSNVTGSPVNTKVAQTSWNLDVMDGTGKSGVTIDWTKTQIFFFDFEWLGVGRVRLGLVIDGAIYYVHQFLNTNVIDTVYMSTPNLPLTYQIITTGSSPASSLVAICSTVMSEGGLSETGTTRAITTSGTHVAAASENVIYAIIGIRLKPNRLGATIDIVEASIAEHNGNKQSEWMIHFNPTVAGSPTWLDLPNSNLQYFIGAAANTVTGGSGQMIVAGHFTSGSKGGALTSSLKSPRRLGASIAGVADTLILMGRPVGGSSTLEYEGGLTWREEP